MTIAHREAEEFSESMLGLATLRKPVDDFFDKVTVNDENQDFRINRLKLLSQIRSVMENVADFSKIGGDR